MFYESSASGDINLLAFDRPKDIKPILATPANERMPDLSPNGRWLTYVSTETGRAEVYVQAFPGPGGKRQVSMNGGSEPAWSRDGQKLVFLRPTTPPVPERVEVVEVSVSMASPLVIGAQKVLFERAAGNSTSIRAWDLTPDADRFLFVRPVHPPAVSAPHLIELVQNWFEELSRRDSPPRQVFVRLSLNPVCRSGSVRLAIRSFRTSPYFSGVVVLILGLGIGANATMFSIADAVLFRPFPFVDQQRLVIAGEDGSEPWKSPTAPISTGAPMSRRSRISASSARRTGRCTCGCAMV